MLRLTPNAPPADSWLYDMVTGANQSPNPDLVRQEVHGHAWELVELHADELEAALNSGEIRDEIKAVTGAVIPPAGVCLRRAQRYILSYVEDKDERSLLCLLFSYNAPLLDLPSLVTLRSRVADRFAGLVMAELKAREHAGDLSLRLNPEKGDST